MPADSHRRPPCFPPAYASAWGDDRFGLWIEIEVGKVVQRLRWIEPGAFLMGSPETEEMRSSADEALREVCLTEGFWFADTACTQSLWLEVMGNNPSTFNENLENPVENMHWDDVPEFLKVLTARLATCIAALPTEAEWEYACRAGTQTPFSFGETITTGQVNYDGAFPYSRGEVGLSVGKTVPVKSLPANAWGLYQMHGNVWEICADNLNDRGLLGAESQEIVRIVRGGSWLHGAEWARSAVRDPWLSGAQYSDRGFRFVLRLNDGRAERYSE